MAQLKLVLLRHAKAEDSHPKGDHARKLADRGVKQAAKIAKLFKDEGFAPDLVITSDSARTKETTAAVVKALKLKKPLVDERLYLAGLKEIRTVVGELETDAATLLVVGHNPGWSLAVQALCGESVELATSEAAVLTVEADTWDEALALTGAWELVGVVSG